MSSSKQIGEQDHSLNAQILVWAGTLVALYKREGLFVIELSHNSRKTLMFIVDL